VLFAASLFPALPVAVYEYEYEYEAAALLFPALPTEPLTVEVFESRVRRRTAEAMTFMVEQD